MQKKIHIFMEYKIIQAQKHLYFPVMKEIAQALTMYGAESFQWFEAVDQPGLYVEMFQLPDLSSYHTVKQLRHSKEHPVFAKLEECVEGGLEKVHCWAFTSKNNELQR